MPIKSGIEMILHREFINFSFKSQKSHKSYRKLIYKYKIKQKSTY